MADAGARGNAGHSSRADTGGNQSRPASGNQQIDVAIGGHQGRGAVPAGILNQIHGVFRDVRLAQPRPEGIDNGGRTADSLLAAPKNAHVAAFQGQSRRIGGHIGSAFVNDGNDAHRHGYLVNFQAVRTGVAV